MLPSTTALISWPLEAGMAGPPTLIYIHPSPVFCGWRNTFKILPIANIDKFISRVIIWDLERATPVGEVKVAIIFRFHLTRDKFPNF